MRCGCPECDAYMIHAEDEKLGCVCPSCGYRCNACLGTKTALSHEQVLQLKQEYARRFGKQD